jgi:uncharacterized protein (TIGR03435 family)
MKSRFHGAAGVVALLGGIAGVHAAQTPASPAFEVASIKLNKTGDRASHGVVQPGGRFVNTNVTLLQLIQTSYRMATAQIIGGPDWIRNEHYDIVAKGPDGATPAQRDAMFQNLVAERFGVNFHHETRELAAANLVMARKDGKLGPRLLPATEADSDCSVRARPDYSKPGFTTLPPCVAGYSTGQDGIGQFNARGITMERLASELLGFHIAPFIFDKTNLDGAFNIDRLDYRPNTLSAGPSPDASVDAPTILTALQEELGLKVELIKGPVDVLVIDHAEHPTEN